MVNIRVFEKPQDWTYHKTDEKLQRKVEKLKKHNDIIKSIFDEYEIENYDVSFHRQEILESIIQGLQVEEKSKLKKITKEN